MISRRAFALGGSSLVVAGSALAQSPKQNWEPKPVNHAGFNWRLVATSDLIVRGILATPTSLTVSRVYRGIERRPSLPFSYREQANCGPKVEAITALKARDGMYCLVASDSGYALTGCWPEAAVGYNEAHESALLKEIDGQRKMVRRVATLVENDAPPFESSVATAIKTAMSGDNVAAMRVLRRSGLPAAPAMVKLLEDRRKLPKDAVEKATVSDVADLMMYALDQLAKDGKFGWPSADMPGMQRQRIVDAWRVWLGYALGMDAA